MSDSEAPQENTPAETSTEFDEVKQLIKQGRKMEAIKQLRADTGKGLKEAKETAEAIQAKMVELGEMEAPSASGCAGMVLLMITASAAMYYGCWA
ncbi:MAG: hypothetical protein ACKVH8_21040 [Pirellulales bacterium]